MNPGSVFESPFSGCDSHVSRADEQEVAGIAVSGPVVFQFPTFLKHQEPETKKMGAKESGRFQGTLGQLWHLKPIRF